MNREQYRERIKSIKDQGVCDVQVGVLHIRVDSSGWVITDMSRKRIVGERNISGKGGQWSNRKWGRDVKEAALRWVRVNIREDEPGL